MVNWDWQIDVATVAGTAIDGAEATCVTSVLCFVRRRTTSKLQKLLTSRLEKIRERHHINLLG